MLYQPLKHRILLPLECFLLLLSSDLFTWSIQQNMIMVIMLTQTKKCLSPNSILYLFFFFFFLLKNKSTFAHCLSGEGVRTPLLTGHPTQSTILPIFHSAISLYSPPLPPTSLPLVILRDRSQVQMTNCCKIFQGLSFQTSIRFQAPLLPWNFMDQSHRKPCKLKGKMRKKAENWKWKEGKLWNEERTLFFLFFFFFASHFSKSLNFILGLPKWKFSTRKKHFMQGKKSEKMTFPPQKNVPVMPLPPYKTQNF